MERLWAPWRTEYIKLCGAEKGRCLFCTLRRLRDERKGLILYRNARALVVMNRYPYNSGHLMVAPVRHIANFEDLQEDEAREVLRLVQAGLRLLRAELKPHGFNLGANLGRVAGAGVAGHLHLHIVPRWPGDTNFMPVLSDTKVVSEALLATYDRLRPGFDRLGR